MKNICKKSLKLNIFSKINFIKHNYNKTQCCTFPKMQYEQITERMRRDGKYKARHKKMGKDDTIYIYKASSLYIHVTLK